MLLFFIGWFDLMTVQVIKNKRCKSALKIAVNHM